MTTPREDARPGYARFDGTETPEEVEAKMTLAFSPLTAMLEGWRRARIRHYRQHPPRDSRGRFVGWPR